MSLLGLNPQNAFFQACSVEPPGKPEMPLILGRSGTQYAAMVTRLLLPYCRAHLDLVESYCKESNIFDANWLKYLFSSYLIKIRLNVRHHH